MKCFVFAMGISHPVYAGSPTQPLKFNFPLKCAYGKSCFIQNYFDVTSNNKARDYRCAEMTYNGHTGTDIRIKDLKTMKAGVDVIAAAPGTVYAVRNNMADLYLDNKNRAQINPVGLGNAVVLEHSNGWKSIYGHMKKGSVRVKKGDNIPAGTVIGQIGLSGLTEFPHLHFGIKHNGVSIDPFTATKASNICGNTLETLWSDNALEIIAYLRGYVLDYGFSSTPPAHYKQAETGELYDNIQPGDNTVFFWARLVGTIPNDRIELKLYSDDNQLIKKNQFRKVTRYKAQQIVYMGVKRNELDSPISKAQINLWRNQALYINKTISAPQTPLSSK